MKHYKTIALVTSFLTATSATFAAAATQTSNPAYTAADAFGAPRVLKIVAQYCDTSELGTLARVNRKSYDETRSLLNLALYRTQLPGLVLLNLLTAEQIAWLQSKHVDIFGAMGATTTPDPDDIVDALDTTHTPEEGQTDISTRLSLAQDVSRRLADQIPQGFFNAHRATSPQELDACYLRLKASLETLPPQRTFYAQDVSDVQSAAFFLAHVSEAAFHDVTTGKYGASAGFLTLLSTSKALKIRNHGIHGLIQAALSQDLLAADILVNEHPSQTPDTVWETLLTVASDATDSRDVVRAAEILLKKADGRYKAKAHDALRKAVFRAPYDLNGRVAMLGAIDTLMQDGVPIESLAEEFKHILAFSDNAGANRALIACFNTWAQEEFGHPSLYRVSRTALMHVIETPDFDQYLGGKRYSVRVYAANNFLALPAIREEDRTRVIAALRQMAQTGTPDNQEGARKLLARYAPEASPAAE